MKSFTVFAFATLFFVTAYAGDLHFESKDASLHRASKKHLKPFASEAELRSFFKKITRKRRGVGYGIGNGSGDGVVLPPATMGAATADVVASGKPAPESITNIQEAGVDEGGIVKLHGDHLVVLRRGRLFTISIGDNSLKPVASINAFGPDIDPSGTWYDEMLISDNNIVVIGYSYERGGTEIGLFKIDSDGGLKYRSTYHLRSNDYYSSRNYSSRLIGNKLIFYSPLELNLDDTNPFDSLPALRKWHKGAKESEFHRIVTANHIYRTEQPIGKEEEVSLHTVTTCYLSGSEMRCDAESVIGPSGNVFYVSPKSVYVWAASWDSDSDNNRNRSMLFRMPLDGSDPTAMRVSGAPVDQFSFLEAEDDNLNVLVRAESAGDGMWGAEVAEGEIALLHLSPDLFSDGSAVAPATNYKVLPTVEGYTFQNRYVGDYLMYGTGSGWGTPETNTQGKLFVVNWKTGGLSTIKLPNNVDRLDALVNDGIVVGSGGKDLYFTSVRLDAMPRVIDTYSIRGASQGETRSQGFFYKPDGADSGMLGLPINVAGRPGYKQLREGSASIVFLKNNALRFSELGQLLSGTTEVGDDGCQASCVDWYGNARPIFARGRVFALLGYEVVEGSLRSDHVEELRRVDFSPKQESASSR